MRARRILIETFKCIDRNDIYECFDNTAIPWSEETMKFLARHSRFSWPEYCSSYSFNILIPERSSRSYIVVSIVLLRQIELNSFYLWFTRCYMTTNYAIFSIHLNSTTQSTIYFFYLHIVKRLSSIFNKALSVCVYVCGSSQ